ncbi:MAG TPA: bifunctional hydroxymethylpyrimidine kinase/phosphomethylpyrimidine kinase [Vicinamibacterales bacterium]|nr:bifunctional hydroxymethylpyrimidine kinase/phosphomethylpyrimidine kinase [Vicinamibacterales bacterium]
MRTALTIAGSDSGGGAGLQADLKTFAAHGVFGLSAITAVTAQNTLAVSAVFPLPPEIVTAQIAAVVTDLEPAATKVGMLATSAIAEAVARAIERHGLRNVVLDTVMVAKGGARLIDDEAIAVLRERLLPLARVVTPNIPEAERLIGTRIADVSGSRRAARGLVEAGARAVLVKGGHLDGPAIDVLDDGRDIVEFRAERIAGRHTHGTGCTLSSAIAARLALGHDLRRAIEGAKAYVTEAIASAPGLGHGHGPLGTPRVILK